MIRRNWIRLNHIGSKLVVKLYPDMSDSSIEFKLDQIDSNWIKISCQMLLWSCSIRTCLTVPLSLKGLVQLVPRLYNGWGFLPSQWDRQLKFSAYASFNFDFVEPFKIWAYLDNFFFIVSKEKEKEKEKCWKTNV